MTGHIRRLGLLLALFPRLIRKWTYVAGLEVAPWIRALERFLARMCPRMRFYSGQLCPYILVMQMPHTQLAAVGERLATL